ncbi:hypothetical protein [Arenicella xantha]|uniref:Uncharacterized protein n=1 Tax=Arenicella xantha TaxID=644221 RepID=A0A395JHF9_9GAMM|nr:hypothetical protein [Arenicella xantha]RBP49577.1 hypothetical protein DFR28_1032 [Arenicella xantha]
MPESIEITLWERFDSNSKSWKYNHYSEGFFEDQDRPIPKGKVQEGSWPSGTWRKQKAVLKVKKIIEE